MFSIYQKTDRFLNIIVTHECNKQCPFCIDKYRGLSEYLTIDSLNKILLFAKSKNIDDILITGGEPTLHPNIVYISSLIKEAGFRTILTTNYTSPCIVKELDGIIDCFNISFYNQPELPKQKNFKSNLTLHALINKKQLATKKELDLFIAKYKGDILLKFSTLSVCNSWTKENQAVDYLDELDSEHTILFNEILGQIYKGAIIKRHDKIMNKNADQSYKAHLNGKIIKSWNRG